MNNLYKPIPVGKIQSWQKDIASFGGEPDTYKTANFHLDSGASARFELPIPIRHIKGLRIEEVHVTAEQPVPVVYIHSHALTSLLAYNTNIIPTHGWDSAANDIMIDVYSDNSVVGVYGTQLAIHNTSHFNTFVNASPEFLPCRGGDLLDSIDLNFRTGATEVENVIGIFLKIGFMCRDQLRS